MAHRKPLGTTFTSTFDWQGLEPGLHDALVSQAGTWYRVVGVAETASLLAALQNPDVNGRRYRIKLTLERVAEPRTMSKAAGSLVLWPDGLYGRMYEFEWYPRDRRRAVA